MGTRRTPQNPLKRRLRAGGVYRREDFKDDSTAVDRHLQQLVKAGELVKLAGGIYHHPRKTTFGAAPADPQVLLKVYLKDDRFLVTSLNAYNSLGVGTTQLYNETIVYNHKRHEVVKLGGRSFRFVRKAHFPKTPTPEFLLVDLVNNVTRLAEDRVALLAKVREKAHTLDRSALQRAVRRFGGAHARKFFAELAMAADAG